MEFYNPFGVSQGKMSIVIKKKYAARPSGARGGTAALKGPARRCP